MASAPLLTLRYLTTIAVAGAFATLAFELYGQTLSPLLQGLVPTMGPRLPPGPLANQAIANVFGMDGGQVAALGLGYAAHILAGMFVYPAVWALGVRPLYRRFAPKMRMAGAAVLYGVLLWIFALFFVAHLAAGNPAFLGFTNLTWVALWGHILYALVAATIVWARMR
jgi:hypothetical protein